MRSPRRGKAAAACCNQTAPPDKPPLESGANSTRLATVLTFGKSSAFTCVNVTTRFVIKDEGSF
jgi:hypothetical protein